MKKFEKNILFVSIISLVLAMIFSTVTLFVGAANAIKVLKDDGVKTVFDLMEYGTKKLDNITETGKIVVDDNGEDKVLVDFNNGIHVNTGKETVDIDKTGIHVNN